MNDGMLISVIVTTYNWPSALRLVLQGLNSQIDNNFEVIVADDGSGEETKELIETFQRKSVFTLGHYWQKDEGFRAARCRNQAVLKSQGEYLIFLDGDCIPRKDFVYQHRSLAMEKRMIRGNRVKLNERITQQLTTGGNANILTGFSQLIRLRLRADIQRIFPLLKLPLGFFRDLKKTQWKGVKTCNLALYRKDFEGVNGFNEAFQGWGHEDADLAIRLIRNSVFRKEGTFATTVFHCHHAEQDRANEEKNRHLLQQSFHGEIQPPKGLHHRQSKT